MVINQIVDINVVQDKFIKENKREVDYILKQD